MMRMLLLLGVALTLALGTACGEQEAADAAPVREDTAIVDAGEQPPAEIKIVSDGQEEVDPAPETAAVSAVDPGAHYEAAFVAEIPATLDAVTAGMTQTTDADGNAVYEDATRTVTGFEWDTEGGRGHLLLTESDAFRYLAQYAPNGKLVNVTAVPLSAIDPAVCADEYTTYAELYFYGSEFFGYLFHTKEDGVVMQTSYAPAGQPLFTYAIALNVYGEAEETALYDAAGALVCRVYGAEDAPERRFEDGSGNTIPSDQYDELLLDVCGDWLNDYYGSVYGA